MEDDDGGGDSDGDGVEMGVDEDATSIDSFNTFNTGTPNSLFSADEESASPDADDLTICE